MSIFSPKTRFGRCSFLEGFTDCHSHILPGVDDGVKTMDKSLDILARYEAAGITDVWLTPHIMEDVPNTTEGLRKRFDELQEAWKGGVRLHLASENMMDVLFEKRLQDKDFLPLPGNRLLVETSYYNPPMDLHGILDAVKSAGYYPVLAHPERYIYMDAKDYDRLKREDILFQLNLSSLLGLYGRRVRAKAESLLRKGCYNFSGTDLHRESMFVNMMQASFPKKYLKLIPHNDFLR